MVLRSLPKLAAFVAVLGSLSCNLALGLDKIHDTCVVSECPTPSNPCEQAICNADACGTANVPAGTPTSGQSSGACTGLVCDGSGHAKMTDFDAGTACATGTCDGKGTCVACKPKTCADLMMACGKAPDGCGGMLDCNNGMKDGNETDVDCGGPGDPNLGIPACPPCQQGSACTVDNDCALRHCADGICCDKPCTDVCYQCNLPDSIGTCAPTPKLMENKTCVYPGADQMCDGQGNCKWATGHQCTSDADCASGVCFPMTPFSYCN